MKALNRGFTFPEVIVMMGIFVILAGITTVSLLKVQRTASVESATQTFLADFKDQQTKAMAGEAGSSFGVRIEASRYILFRGTVYSESDIANQPIDLEEPIEMSTTFGSSTVVFNEGSGEITGFTDGQNTITLVNTTNSEQKEIEFNRYGAFIKE